MNRQFFVTGTDTDCGKTLVSCALLVKAGRCHYSTLGLKPVAAGLKQVNGQWLNDDVVSLAQYSSVVLAWEKINPVALRLAIAPHIAARREGLRLSVQQLASELQVAGGLSANADFTVVEGAGGWLVPVNDRETMADLVASLKLPVVLTVGLKLGCLNHALLTAAAIAASNLKLCGWIGTAVQPQQMEALEENIEALKQRLPGPCLGVIPPLDTPPNPEIAAEYIELPES